MKIKPINGKTLGANAPVVLAAVGGAMVGRGLTHVIAKPAGVTPTQAELDKKMYVQGVMAVGGYLGYSVIDGNDTMAEAASGACLGIAIDNTITVVSTLLNKSTAITTALKAKDTDSKTIAAAKDFGAAALGLACPCDTTMAYQPAQLNRSRHRSLRMPNDIADNANHFLGDSVNAGSILLYAN